MILRQISVIKNIKNKNILWIRRDLTLVKGSNFSFHFQGFKNYILVPSSHLWTPHSRSISHSRSLACAQNCATGCVFHAGDGFINTLVCTASGVIYYKKKYGLIKGLLYIRVQLIRDRRGRTQINITGPVSRKSIVTYHNNIYKITAKALQLITANT